MRAIDTARDRSGGQRGARQERLLLLALVSFALVIRLVLMLSLRTYQFPTEKQSVGAEMGWIAYNLANNKGFMYAGSLTTWMAPLYPYVLSLVYRLFGSHNSASAIATLVVQSVASSLTVVPLYLIGKRLHSPRIGAITGFVWALWPGAIYCAIRLVWSTSFTALGLTMTVLLFQRLCDEPSRFLWACLCGLVAALTALSEPVILAILPLAALWVLWRRRQDRIKALLQLGVMSIVLVACLMPWTIRNYMLFGSFVPIKAQLGVNLWLGNHSPAVNQASAGIGLWDKIEEIYPDSEVAYLSSLNEIERDRALRHRAVTFIIAHPDTFFHYVLERVYLFWRKTAAPHGTLWDRALMGLVPLTCLGIVLSMPRWRETALILSVFISFPVIYYVSHADFYRFRFPIEGLMLVFVACAIDWTIERATFSSAISATKPTIEAKRRRNRP